MQPAVQINDLSGDTPGLGRGEEHDGLRDVFQFAGPAYRDGSQLGLTLRFAELVRDHPCHHIGRRHRIRGHPLARRPGDQCRLAAQRHVPCRLPFARAGHAALTAPQINRAVRNNPSITSDDPMPRPGLPFIQYIGIQIMSM